MKRSVALHVRLLHHQLCQTFLLVIVPTCALVMYMIREGRASSFL